MRDGAVARFFDAREKPLNNGPDLCARNKNVCFPALGFAGVVGAGACGCHIEGLFIVAVNGAAAGR